MTSETIISNILTYLNTQHKLSKGAFNNIQIYPKKNKVFNCFNCDFNTVKVVFIGKKPFDNYSEGLAFDSTEEERLLHPVSELFRYTIENEFHDGLNLAHDHTLNYLVKQGVLLLNESLTSCNRLDHSKIWSNLFTTVIETIQFRHTGIVFCMQEDSKYIELINTKLHHLLTFKDPLKYVDNYEKWGFKFKAINDIIVEANGEDNKINF